MIDIEYIPGAIALIYYNRNNREICENHSHHNPEKVMDLIQKGTFLELTEELASHEGCVAAFKNFKKSSEKKVKRDKYRDKYTSGICARIGDIATIQVATKGISSDTKMMGLLEKRIEQVISKMFEQQDKSSESSEKTK